MANGLGLERRFRKILDEVGADYTHSPGVSCNKPVPDKNGEWRKTSASLDFRVDNPDNGNYRLVELTLGGFSPHKLAQLRVVKKAGEAMNKITITKLDVEKMESIDSSKLPKLFRRAMEWDR